MNALLDLLAGIGRSVIGAARGTGSLTVFAGTGLSHAVRPPFYARLFGRALLEMGYFSLPVVALTAVFTGMVLALQSYTGFSRYSAESAIPNIVVLSITRELGPVLAGLMVAGRIGAAMAAELGTMRATQLPMVLLTSNNTRELSEALKRRCLYLHIDYPDLEREREIVRTKVPGISEELADQVARIVRSLRTLELRKAPSVSETIDWARTLVLLGVETIDAAGAKDTLHILLKYQADIERASKELLSASAS